MKPSTLQDAIRLQFDYLMKCAIDSTVKNYRRHVSIRSKLEIPFTDVSINVDQIGVADKYEVESTSFEIKGVATVQIQNEQLANALQEIKEKKRDIVLMFYCLEASDIEIAKALKISPSTSYRNRHSALAEIQKILQEE